MSPELGFGTEDVTTLEDYLAAVRNRKWVVLATALAMLTLAYLATARSVDTYTATATVEVGKAPQDSNNTTGVGGGNLELEREKLQSDAIASLVARDIPGETASSLKLKLKASFIPQSQFITVEVTDTDPERAAAIATGFVRQYAAERQAVAVGIFQSQVTALQESISSNEDALRALQVDEAKLVADRLFEARGTNRPEVLADFDNRLTEIRADQSFNNTRIRQDGSLLAAAQLSLQTLQPAATVIQEAAIPGAPNGVPRSWLLTGVTIFGLLIGTAVAFLAERLDATARDEDDVSLALGTRVLGSIPTFPLSNRSGSSAAIMAVPDRKPRLALCREAFRRLRSSVQFAAATADAQVYLITSAYPGEGKSVVSANLAIALAQSGKQVALISADMRRPTMEKVLDVPNSEGLSDFLQGQVEMELKTVRGVDNLWVVPSGPPPANPGELLGSVQFETLIKELRQMAAFILIDTPPVLSTADAATAATYVDGVLVVIDSRKTETSDLLRVRDDLERAGAPLAGGILNRTRGKRGLFSRRDAYAYYETGQS